MRHYCLVCGDRIYSHGLCEDCGFKYYTMWKDLKKQVLDEVEYYKDPLSIECQADAGKDEAFQDIKNQIKSIEKEVLND